MTENHLYIVSLFQSGDLEFCRREAACAHEHIFSMIICCTNDIVVVHVWLIQSSVIAISGTVTEPSTLTRQI